MGSVYTIGLSVSGESKVASAASATERLASDLDGAAAAADSAAAGFAAAASASQSLASRLDAGVAEAAKHAQSAVKDLSVKVASGSAAFRAYNFGEMEGAVGKLGGPLGRLAQRALGVADSVQKMSKGMSMSSAIMSTLALGAAGVVAALAAIAAVAVAAGAALVGATITMADASNKMDTLRQVLTGSASAGAALSATIAKVSQRVPLASSAVAKLGDDLYKSGKRGKELEDALLAASYEAAGLGKNPGPDLIAKRMSNLDVIGMRLKDHIFSIFAGAKTKTATEKFGSALSGVTERFGANRAEGYALQSLLAAVATPLINGLTKLMPLATSVFRGMVMLALDVAIAVVKARNAVIKMIPPETLASIKSFASSESTMKAATIAITVVLVALGVVLAGVIALVIVAAVIFGAILLTAITVVLAPFLLVAAAIAAVIAVLPKIGPAISAAATALGSLASAGLSAAKNMISGIVSGITSGVGAVVAAMKALASSAIAGLKSALKISSPSRVFAELGSFTGEGFTVGVEHETTAVQGALETMVSPPESPSMQVPRASPPDASPSRSIGVGGGITINLYGVDGAVDAARRIEDVITRLLEGDVVAAGAG